MKLTNYTIDTRKGKQLEGLKLIITLQPKNELNTQLSMDPIHALTSSWITIKWFRNSGQVLAPAPHGSFALVQNPGSMTTFTLLKYGNGYRNGWLVKLT